jgi:NDP-sugar pyrophosphorylase family protein
VGEGAELKNVIVWPDAKVDEGVHLRDAVVTSKGVCQCDCGPASPGA